MDVELQELRDLVAQLRSENERLQGQQPSVSAISDAQGSNAATTRPSEVNAGTEAVDRFVFVPRDLEGVGINEWVEEAQACMRVRCLSTADKAYFLFDHLEGEAREEIRHRPDAEKGDPDKIIVALRDLYGCSLSYVALQEAFFSRRQQEGETLLEFSLALMSLQEKVKQQSPAAMPNAGVLLRDQFVEFVLDPALRRELKQLVRREPSCNFLYVRSEAIRWEREGMLGGVRARSQSLPLAYGVQYGMQGRSGLEGGGLVARSEFDELKEMLKLSTGTVGPAYSRACPVTGFVLAKALPSQGSCNM